MPEGKEMSDLAEDFKAWKEHKQEKRADNRENSANILTAKGISFESKNAGAHLIIKHNQSVMDFWPGTGKYIFRNQSKSDRGVFNLIKQLR